jgi:hypothetical protein
MNRSGRSLSAGGRRRRVGDRRRWIVPGFAGRLRLDRLGGHRNGPLRRGLPLHLLVADDHQQQGRQGGDRNRRHTQAPPPATGGELLGFLGRGDAYAA